MTATHENQTPYAMRSRDGTWHRLHFGRFYVGGKGDTFTYYTADFSAAFDAELLSRYMAEGTVKEVTC